MSAIDDTTYSILVMRNIPSIASFLAAFIAIYGSKYQTLLKSSFLNYAQDSSIIADIVLIHRCYKIWGANKKITVLSIFISIMNNVTFIIEVLALVQNLGGGLDRMETSFGEYASRSFLTVNFLTNLAIPSLIAGRIWWIGYQVSKFLPTRQFNLTRHIIAVCLESGIMYPLALIPALVINFSPPNSLSSKIDFVPFLIQIVGIAPTFIIDAICMNEQNGHGDQTVLSMWEANHNIDECVWKDQTAVVSQVGQTIYDQILLEFQSKSLKFRNIWILLQDFNPVQ
ncbi:hypothetical protein K435DRAFT_807091 [Dendrothele bispora CBS 962.96]|uniref:Uncharacterized protein n=1 Tax=Dendrothele bispora (strain CBS 962.96) TaxID=1314807 RepID=A0A4S8L746_DENBC|nr:hypothetical protein K435DRAFT_807091 [Dendrothele bispora CBS 962.96]